MDDVKAREAQLKATARDITAPEAVPGRDGESLRGIKGFEGITDAHLAERAAFNLREHLGGSRQAKPASLDLAALSPEELTGLKAAADSELQNREATNG